MKVGVHGGERLETIVERKRREDEEHGYFLWGYGGALCHPEHQVKVLAQSARLAGSPLWLLMIPTASRHLAREDEVASRFASERGGWEPLAETQNVRASRYALVCHGLEECELRVDLGAYMVAVGPSRTTPVSSYLRGRVDKACAERAAHAGEESSVRVRLLARLVQPYAVYVA
jgi:hypothetical protein